MVNKINICSINDLNKKAIDEIFHLASEFAKNNTNNIASNCKGKNLISVFFENSTRTKVSFEIAAKNLKMNVINVDTRISSLEKGESELSTIRTISAMKPDVLLIRHKRSGAARWFASNVDATVINCGDGTNEHPTQGLLDSFTILQTFKKIKGIRVAICGDILHSRVARSNILLLNLLGAHINLIGPPTLLPDHYRDYNCNLFHSLQEGLKDVQLVMMLRLQKERETCSFIPSPSDFAKLFGLKEDKLLNILANRINKDEVYIMHPGPVNEGVELDTKLAYYFNNSLVQKQVEYGVSVRQAILQWVNNR